VKDDLPELGSMSLGRPSSGSLVNAVPMPTDDGWVVVDPSHAYGTAETVENLRKVITLVAAQHENTPALHIGHISGKHGGPLSPHLSHQAGRDVDLGYYYVEGSKWYQPASAQNLDVERTWSLVRAIIVETDVEFLLIDRSLHPLLRQHAEAKGEDRAWLDDLFRGTPGRTSPMIRHTKGHATHMHVRFWNPLAQETARRCYAALIQEDKIKPPTYMVSHRAKKGDSLLKLAKQYGTTVKAIQRANGLRSTKIFAKRTYKIPRSGPAAIEVGARAVIPARRLPQTPPPSLAPPASQPRAQL
jgi:murein endopeptidase